MTAPPVDHGAVAEALAALAYASRLELMEAVRFPKALGEIQLVARRASESDSPERIASRQAVSSHLGKLVAVDLVREEQSADGGRAGLRYVANAPRLYEIIDDLRRVCVRSMSPILSVDDTRTMTHVPPAASASGPRLVLVRGVYEGRIFPLTDENAESGAWTIGRRQGLAIPLEFDRFVSTENAVIRRTREGFSIADMNDSKNGTHVNWLQVPSGATAPLKAGDVVSVGKSVLVFAGD